MSSPRVTCLSTAATLPYASIAKDNLVGLPTEPCTISSIGLGFHGLPSLCRCPLTDTLSNWDSNDSTDVCGKYDLYLVVVLTANSLLFSVSSCTNAISWSAVTYESLALWRGCCHIGTAIKHPVPDRVELSFAIFDIPALLQHWRSDLSVKVPGCQKITNYCLTRPGTGRFIAVPIC